MNGTPTTDGARASRAAAAILPLVPLVAAPPAAGAPPPARRPPLAAPAAGDTTRACRVTDAELRTVTALLARWTDRRRRLADVPGLVLGVACGPARTWTRGFGLADPGRDLAAADTTLFRIASITKVFTAHAVLRLRDEGRLALGDAVAEHLPWFEPANADGMPPVTIRHLLTHTSGLPANSAATDFNRMTQPTPVELRARLSGQRLLFRPGSAFKYSNLGYAVLGQVVEAASDEPYARYLERQVFAPLDFHRTVAHPSPDALQAVGHHLRVPGRPRRPADFLHLAAFTPAGGMATTATDMVRFLAVLLAPERRPGVVAPRTLREMQRVHHRVDSAGAGSGLGWAVERGSRTHVIYHGGGLPTQTSHLRLDLRRGFGVVVLTNAEDGGADVYAREALALLELAAGNGEEDGERHDPTLERYAGRYRFQERELWVVRLSGGLGLIDPKAERPSSSFMPLTPTGAHRFRVEAGWAREETATFVVDETIGDVLRLRMPGLMYRRVGPVETGFEPRD